VVVVVGTTTGTVVVVAGAAGGTVVWAVAPCVDVSAVPAVLAFVAAGAVVVVDRGVEADRDEAPESPARA
jgi:2-keto-3-deoxy-galactonokinase